MDDEIEPHCASFFAHWKALRGDALMPTVEAFLDHASPDHAPWMLMVEVDGDDVYARLQGTGLVARVGREITGIKMYQDKSPEFVRNVVGMFHTILSQPCGWYGLNRYSLGRTRNVRLLHLPLAAKPGRPPRVVSYSIELERQSMEDVLPHFRTTIEARWIDIGAGVPRDPPERISG